MGVCRLQTIVLRGLVRDQRQKYGLIVEKCTGQGLQSGESYRGVCVAVRLIRVQTNKGCAFDNELST